MNKLEEYRNMIDKLDDNIKSLLIERMNVIKNIKNYKANNDLQIEDRIREKFILDSISEGVNDEYKDAIVSIFKEIINSSKIFQNK